MIGIIRKTCCCWLGCLFSSKGFKRATADWNNLIFPSLRDSNWATRRGRREGSELCLNGQISAVPLFEVRHTDGRSKHMTASIMLLHIANMQTCYWLALFWNGGKLASLQHMKQCYYNVSRRLLTVFWCSCTCRWY